MSDKLSQDASAALAAGMSYGYYKALHPHTEYAPARREPTGKIIPCAMCGKPFGSIHNRKYCSVECSSEKNAIAVLERYHAKKGGNTK